MLDWGPDVADAHCQQNGAAGRQRKLTPEPTLPGATAVLPVPEPTCGIPSSQPGDLTPLPSSARQLPCLRGTSKRATSAASAGAGTVAPSAASAAAVQSCSSSSSRRHRRLPLAALLPPRSPLPLLLPLLLLMLLLLLAPLLLALLPSPAVVRADLTRYYGNISYPLDEQMSYCDTLDELYDGIAVDLRHWNNSAGINRESLDLAIGRYTTSGGQKGMALAFYGGVPYVIAEPKLAGLGHHVNILFTYMLVMLDLARQYGSSIPDLEFVIASSDRPLVLTAAQQPGLMPPVMRFCSSDEHADIKIPIFHFYTKKYTAKYLANAESLAAKYPWGQRQPVVFGRFSKYHRYIHPLANSTLRLGARNLSICREESPMTLTCPVRAHFMEWAARRHPELLDVKSGPRVSLEKHAEYKYLIHLDGQALSSRLEQLLPLRSLVLKEDSGYKTFYYHLVRPYEHYIPVWKAGGGPEDVLGAVRWAMAHEEQAERMAAAAQAVALKYLSKRARSCYWWRLMKAYASLQRFVPSPANRSFQVPVAAYLETVGRSWEKGGQLHKIEY